MAVLSVVVPADNEGAGITSIVKRLLSSGDGLARIGLPLELLVVKDGLYDCTAIEY